MLSNHEIIIPVGNLMKKFPSGLQELYLDVCEYGEPPIKHQRLTEKNLKQLLRKIILHTFFGKFGILHGITQLHKTSIDCIRIGFLVRVQMKIQYYCKKILKEWRDMVCIVSE